MDLNRSTPPATARPKNSSSSIASAHAASSSQQSLTMAPSPRATRGGTPTASRSATKLVDDKAATRPASRDSLKQKMLKKPEEAPRPSKSEEVNRRSHVHNRTKEGVSDCPQQLKLLRTDLDSLRQNLTCKICARLFYQPYTIACGHTYCYTCLCTWFANNKNRKTCPDCRVVVKEMPAPAYVIRDMTTILIGRAELLPPDETLDDHKKWQKEEADAVQQDKDNQDPRTGGLFKGCFKGHIRGPSLQVLRDNEDGVDRCPVCTWELEDGGCQQCGLIFDESGEVSWGDSFTGFSDMDEMSEHDTEDIDAELDMEDVDYGAYENWEDYLPEQGSFMMRRFLEAGMAPNAAAFARRRPLTHSEAGSRRSYSQSIVSDMYGDEMDTVEEEDEDGAEEDSEMNDFIDDEDIDGSASNESSTPGPPVQPTNSQARSRARNRRIVESETSSTISSVIEEEEEDEEDQGPIRPVRRGPSNPAQARFLNRANGSRSSRGAPSSTSTDVSTDDLDEDTQALLRDQGWGMLQHDDDEMGEDEDEDSDGGRTTVGWEPLANSNDRSRMAGSLTPTADRPRPSAPIRPPSRTGNIHLMNAPRGLRQRSSVLSTSTVHYEDGEADDDDSDQDGDITMHAMHSLRSRRSQAQMRNIAAFSNPQGRFGSRTPVQNRADPDADDNSDTSQPGNGRRAPRTQRREYDPRISWMFAAHQRALQEHQMTGALIDVEPRSITPLARPRTANRNRPSPAQAYSPFLPPNRLRTPLMDNTSNVGPNSRLPVSPPRRSAMSPALPQGTGTGGLNRVERAPSITSTSTGSVIMTPGTSTPNSQDSIDRFAQAQAGTAVDLIDRPESRVSARPPSATGRRASANFSPVYPPFHNASMGLHGQGPVLPPYQAHGNPWAAFVQARGLRNRNSRQILREQSSVATLRAASSRANVREAATVNPPPAMRPQASRILRPQASRRQLSNQASTRTLRASDHARPPPSPSHNVVQTATQPAPRPVRLTQDERDTRARELVENRLRALGQPNAAPPVTNPFTRRAVNPVNAANMQAPSNGIQHTRSNSNESMQSVNSSGTISAAPASPVLGRRRSNRNMMNAPPPGVLPVAQGAFTSPATAYANSYTRPRQNPLSGVTNAYDSPLNVNNRGLNPIPAGHLI
ncbi:hypothetical protein FB567DRAFT_143672 [Paraphoma chrysanthemicola]|uniref:RING-type domain-containing protein n=1 Tax=Paraphoma chrysanthemicola TaxID=798071 RepID=A0A8K0VUF5_9PLEO|nr:hypothetical protein FB567DRAFT_143672 [Paraphoma chrysanthemicola]